MKIHSVRLGHATNSSSTHSIVILPNAARYDDTNNSARFGWEFFTAGARESKLDYFALTVYYALYKLLNDDVMAKIVTNALCGVDLFEDEDDIYSPYIDHQSVLTLPSSFGSNPPHPEFLKEFREFLLRDNVAILGGNDNVEEAHPLLSQGREIHLPLPRDNNLPIKARKDAKYGYWTIYNPHTGAKARLSFYDQVDIPNKAYAPELVDVCITHACPFECEFCYENATPGGKIASWDSMMDFAFTMARLEVFEVAIGGGEPTLHPKFNDFVRLLANRGVTPNFSTRNLAWFYHPANRELLRDVGGFALSVQYADEVEELAALVKLYRIPVHKASVQVVVGVPDEWTFRDILETAAQQKLRVTLLGYKSVGRGENYTPKKYDWLEIYQALGCKPTLSIDTALAKASQERLDEANVPRYLYRVKEGEFSMCVDLVNNTMGRASHEKDTFVEFGDELTADKVVKQFAQW